MRKPLTFLYVLAALLAVDTSMRADPVQWNFSAATTQIVNNDTQQATSSITFTGSSGTASGDSSITIYNLTSASSADASAPNSFTDVPIDLKITLTDVAASSSTDSSATKSGVIELLGAFSASNVSKISLLTGKISFADPYALTLGSSDSGWHRYEMSIVSLPAPAQPGDGPVSFKVMVHITPTSGPREAPHPGDPSTTPEPSTLLLAGLAVPVLLIHRRNRRVINP